MHLHKSRVSDPQLSCSLWGEVRIRNLWLRNLTEMLYTLLKSDCIITLLYFYFWTRYPRPWNWRTPKPRLSNTQDIKHYTEIKSLIFHTDTLTLEIWSTIWILYCEPLKGNPGTLLKWRSLNFLWQINCLKYCTHLNTLLLVFYLFLLFCRQAVIEIHILAFQVNINVVAFSKNITTVLQRLW